MLHDALPSGATRYYSLARWALVDALRVCGIERGDPVLLPELICREVLASLDVLAATPVFYPVSRGLCAAVRPRDLPTTKAVLAVNYFGFPQDLDVLREYCAHSGAALIEDNAHGLFSRDARGRLLGSRGDAGLFSFRKTIAVPDGGALVLAAGRTLPAQAAPAVPAVPIRYRLKQAFRRVAGRMGAVHTLRAIAAVRHVRRAADEQASSSAPDAETRIPVSPHPRALIARALRVAEPEIEAGRRRALYEFTARVLEAIGGTPVFPRLPVNTVPYGFPVLASPSEAPRIAAHLARHGLLLTRWPALPAAIASSTAEHYRHLWVVPFLW